MIIGGYRLLASLLPPIGNRTDAVLVRSLIDVPAARIASASEARGWWDRLVATYGLEAGITFPSRQIGGGENRQAEVAVAVDEHTIKRLRTLMVSQVGVLAPTLPSLLPPSLPCSHPPFLAPTLPSFPSHF